MMTTTTVEKFTPGPWAVQAMHQILWIGTPKENGQLGELILHINQDESYNTEKKERNIANAKLIAAAPEMYAVLKELYDWSINNNVRGSIFPKLEAAIKKATE